MQNRYIERFNRVNREAILDAYLFTDIHEVRALTEEWIEEYNERRPHEALQNRIPTKWKQQIEPKLNTLNLSAKGGTYTLILVCVMLQSDCYL
jgi:transposase InsO family protein